MGTKDCFRNGCENSMCNRYSEKYGYICHDCFEEMTKNNIPISEFIVSEKRNNLSEHDYEKEFTKEGD